VQSKITRENGYVRIRLGNPHSTISGKHIYVIAYRDEGVLALYDSLDELYWNVTGNQWGVPIEQATAIVRLPQQGIKSIACYEGFTGSQDQCQAQSTQTEATFSATRILEAGEGMTISLGYTKGMVPILTVAPRTFMNDVNDALRNNSDGIVLFF